MAENKRKAVAIWLLIGVVMIIIQIFIGGVTRLTGSGLSITEWQPIMGAFPPMNNTEWDKAFSAYKEIAQYKYLNYHFTLSDFKFIFFWEWFHRLWARLLGVVFLTGFFYFLIRRYFDREMVIPFVILFVLGAIQGLIGWIMVLSGLNQQDLYVNHIKLALHFMAALLLLCYTLWFALKLLIPSQSLVRNSRLHGWTLALIVLLAVQLVYGAFMAGLRAAPYAPTWPSMNGVFMPEGFWMNSWINDPLNVQFIHRMLAYLLVLGFAIWFIQATLLAYQHMLRGLRKTRWLPLILVLIQVNLGIFTVLHGSRIGASRFGSYEIFAELHQLFAMLLLVSMIIHLYLIRKENPAKM